MRPDPDEVIDHLSTRRAPADRSAGFWISVITAGVILGNVITFAGQEFYQRWELHQFFKAMNIALEAWNKEAALAQEKRAAENARRTKALRAEQARQRSYDELCDFWQQRVRKEGGASNTHYRDLACARAAGMFR